MSSVRAGDHMNTNVYIDPSNSDYGREGQTQARMLLRDFPKPICKHRSECWNGENGKAQGKGEKRLGWGGGGAVGGGGGGGGAGVPG